MSYIQRKGYGQLEMVSSNEHTNTRTPEHLNTMTRPDILKGPWKLNGANVTAKADWQLLVASPPYLEAPKPTPDALAVTEGEAMQLAVAIHALPDLLAALEMLLFTSESQLDQSSTHDGLRNCKVLADTRQALTKAGYEFDFAAKK